MPGWENDEEDDEFEADEFDAEDYDADDEEEATIDCPYCGRQIHEDSQRCPHCEQYLSEEDAPAGRKPWWIVAGAVICLYVVFRWIFG